MDETDNSSPNTVTKEKEKKRGVDFLNLKKPSLQSSRHRVLCLPLNKLDCVTVQGHCCTSLHSVPPDNGVYEHHRGISNSNGRSRTPSETGLCSN
ncbi:hypothetical protein CDAR_438401 [Caerostris darwini]|uniref:Uncharacterized protein n=1 Tax=Caerostris darwini TaxID=1538125 RepID=A0AAV4X2H7_9ARAC|nr:hypothetical protein CDAR_438401 [Caerostris darwini]